MSRPDRGSVGALHWVVVHREGDGGAVRCVKRAWWFLRRGCVVVGLVIVGRSEAVAAADETGGEMD